MKDDALKRQLAREFSRLPDSVRSPPAPEDQLVRFEGDHGPIPGPFRWFLATCGGGPVGSEWVDGIEDLTASHEKFARERDQGFWPELADVFIIGWDGAGNPFGIHRADGRVLREDHDFGGFDELTPSFMSFLDQGFRPEEEVP